MPPGKLARCNICRDSETAFRIPFPLDAAGRAMMQEHMRSEHQLSPVPTAAMDPVEGDHAAGDS